MTPKAERVPATSRYQLVDDHKGVMCEVTPWKRLSQYFSAPGSRHQIKMTFWDLSLGQVLQRLVGLSTWVDSAISVTDETPLCVCGSIPREDWHGRAWWWGVDLILHVGCALPSKSGQGSKEVQWKSWACVWHPLSLLWEPVGLWLLLLSSIDVRLPYAWPFKGTHDQWVSRGGHFWVFSANGGPLGWLPGACLSSVGLYRHHHVSQPRRLHFISSISVCTCIYTFLWPCSSRTPV